MCQDRDRPRPRKENHARVRTRTPVLGRTFGAILRRRPLGDERLDPGAGCMDVLDRVGRLRALDQRDPTQRLEARRVLVAEDLCPAPSLRDARQRRDSTWGQRPEVTRKTTEATTHPAKRTSNVGRLVRLATSLRTRFPLRAGDARASRLTSGGCQFSRTWSLLSASGGA